MAPSRWAMQRETRGKVSTVGVSARQRDELGRAPPRMGSADAKVTPRGACVLAFVSPFREGKCGLSTMLSWLPLIGAQTFAVINGVGLLGAALALSPAHDGTK
eukprot:8395938-Heterocapsa_arctica.AAC.1